MISDKEGWNTPILAIRGVEVCEKGTPCLRVKLDHPLTRRHTQRNIVFFDATPTTLFWKLAVKTGWTNARTI
jgi:hypothetical protein